MVIARVADPDPRIFQLLDPDPDPGVTNLSENFSFSCKIFTNSKMKTWLRIRIREDPGFFQLLDPDPVTDS